MGLAHNAGSGTTFIMDVRVTIDTLGKVYINWNLYFSYYTHEEKWTKVISL